MSGTSIIAQIFVPLKAKTVLLKISFLISQPKHMLWVIKIMGNQKKCLNEN